MATAGERTCFCDILRPPARSELGESTPDSSAWTVWASAWGKKVGLRGGELNLAREIQEQETEDFYFAYEDVMNPLDDGQSIEAFMAIRFDDGSPGGKFYDIDGVFADETHRREVRVRVIHKRQPV